MEREIEELDTIYTYYPGYSVCTIFTVTADTAILILLATNMLHNIVLLVFNFQHIGTQGILQGTYG